MVIETGISRLLARSAIGETLSTYTFAGDRGDMDMLVSAFVADATLELFGDRFVGRDEIKAGLSTTIDSELRGPEGETLTFLRHNLTSNRIEFTDAGKANVWTYFNVLTPIGLDHCGVYIDKFVQTGDSWLINERRIKVDWIAAHSLVIGSGRKQKGYGLSV